MESSKIEQTVLALTNPNPRKMCFKKYGFICKRLNTVAHDALCVLCQRTIDEQFMSEANKHRDKMGISDEVHKDFVNMLRNELNG